MVTIMNIRDTEKRIIIKDGYVVNPFALTAVDTKLFFSDWNTCGFFELDVFSQTAKCKGRLYQNGDNEKWLYSSALYDNGKIFFIPHVSNALSIYDISSDMIEYELLPNEIIGGASKFYSGVFLGDYLYLFGYGIPAVFRYNIKIHSFERLPDIEKELSIYKGKTIPGGFAIRSCISINNDIFAVSLSSDKLIKINVSSMETELIDVNADGGFSFILKAGDYLWLVPFASGKFIRYSLFDGSLNTLDTGYNERQWTYSGAAVYGNNIIVLPAYYGMPICIKNDMSIHEIEKIKNVMGNTFGNSFQLPAVIDSLLVTAQPSDGYILIYDMENDEVRRFQAKCNDYFIDIGTDVYLENSYLSVDRFIEQVVL